MSTNYLLKLSALFLTAGAVFGQTPVLLTATDHRPTVSLDGDWHAILDPYQTGLYSFHSKLRGDGYFMNAKQEPGGPVIEYDFSKSPTLHVPGDWNTQSEAGRGS